MAHGPKSGDERSPGHRAVPHPKLAIRVLLGPYLHPYCEQENNVRVLLGPIRTRELTESVRSFVQLGEPLSPCQRAEVEKASEGPARRTEERRHNPARVRNL